MAVVTHTFLDKTNSIIYGSAVNLGLNPILEMYYGMPYTRGLLHFDLAKLKRLVADKTYPDLSKLHHRLKMQNVAGLRTPYQHRFNQYNDAKRAKSFNLNFFLIDRPWDMGGGYDYLKDGWDTVNRIVSTDGSNWYQAMNGELWGHDGVMDFGTIADNAVATQHFDVGNENIDIDLTETVNAMIACNIPNYGIGVCFDEENELEDNSYLAYVGFFTDHTHTFFKPYLESTYEGTVSDDRANFYLDKDNRLCFYSAVGGNMENLDEIPTCTIDGAEMEVTQVSKGVYCTELRMDSSEIPPETMFYDTWGNIVWKGRRMPDRELYFTTKPSNNYYMFGLPYETQVRDRIIPTISGMNDGEKVERVGTRRIDVSARIAYTTDQEFGNVDMLYRVYSKAGEAEIDVIGWTPVERMHSTNCFMLDLESLAPGIHFISIMVRRDMEETLHKDLVRFTVLDNKADMEC